MVRENPPSEKRPNIPVYGNGLVPTYYTGSARRSGIPYSKRTKLFGLILVLTLITFVVWVTLSMFGAV